MIVPESASPLDLSDFGERFVVGPNLIASTIVNRNSSSINEVGILVMRKNAGVWEDLAFLNPADHKSSTISGDRLGNSMSLVEDSLSGGGHLLFAGASGHDFQEDGSFVSGVGCFRVFLIDGSDVDQIAKISPGMASPGSDFLFGTSVAAEAGGDFLYVGASGYDRGVPGTSDQGIVYLLRRENIEQWKSFGDVESSESAAVSSGNRFGGLIQNTPNRLFVNNGDEGIDVFLKNGGSPEVFGMNSASN